MDSDRLYEVIRAQTEIAKLGLDLGGVMSAVAERAQALTRADGAVVELAEGEHMVYRAASGSAAAHLGVRVPRAQSLSGLCIAEGTPLVCADSEDDPRVNREACRRVGLRSMLVVPLRHHDQVAGVLKVLSARPHAFGDGDVRVLELVSELIAAAMVHATRMGDDELFRQATHDALTGLPNRALFFERLQARLAQARRDTDRFGVLQIDMDGLKPINDRHGHAAGDEALRELAQRLREVARDLDTVARLGGDEFGVILSQVRDHDSIARCIDRYTQAVDASGFVFEAVPLEFGASIGGALFPDDGDAAAALLDHADHAMYAAKRGRKSAR